jgi:hypothetical protein
MLQGVVVINLDKRPDRLSSFLRSYYASDLNTVPMYRLTAHVGTDIDYKKEGLLTTVAVGELERLKRTRRRDFHAQLTPGGIGCYLSHVDALKFAADLPDQNMPVLIMEDDGRIPPYARDNVYLAWHTAVSMSRGKPFILLLHILCLKGCAPLPNGIIIPERFWSTQAYVINGQSAKAILADDGLFPIDVQFDSQLLYMRNAGLIDIYAIHLFDSNSRDTNIQVDTVPNAPLDRIHVYVP